MLALFLAVGVMGAMRESRGGADILWAPHYEIASEQARQTNKPMLLSFRTPGCGWCKKMEAETFADPQVAELSRRFVCARLDSDWDGKVISRYHVLEYPTLILTNSQGKVLLELPGYIPPDQCARALRALLDALPPPS